MWWLKKHSFHHFDIKGGRDFIVITHDEDELRNVRKMDKSNGRRDGIYEIKSTLRTY